MSRRNAIQLRRRPSTLPRHLRIAALAAVVVALVLASVPDITFAADPPAFDVPPTPPFGATLAVDAGQLVEFPVQASDPDLPTDVVTQITAGGLHTCALLDTGAVRCWGNNFGGKLGYGNFNRIGDDETPASAGDVDVGGTVTQIAAGFGHTCALLDTGTVRCWGFGSFGRLGYGNTSNIGDNETPASAGDVDIGGTVSQITAGTFHTCALLDTGAVRCWGVAGAGRLGYPIFNHIGDDETPASAGDVPVGGTVAQIVGGNHHTCALLDSGAVRCWGFGADGRLGYGNTDSVGITTSPASAGDVDMGGTVAQISATRSHNCALLDTGAVRCWGLNNNGQLGYGNLDNIGDDETPASAGDVDVGGTVAQLAAGGEHTCALLASGAVRCWGTGDDGRLGYGTTDTIGDDETPASAGDVDVVDPGDVVTLGVVGLPAGAGFALAAPANPVSGTFTWVPTNVDAGSHAVTFTAQDSTGLSATPHTINIEVSPTFADLAVTKSVDDSSPGEGDTLTYTVRVTNNGPDAATGVVVSDVIPSGLTLQSATPSDGTYSTGTGNWTLASPLASGASVSLTLVTVLEARAVDSAITNTASVVASDQIDPDAGNDSGLVTVAGPSPLPIPSVGIWGLAITVIALAAVVAWRTRRRAMKA